VRVLVAEAVPLMVLLPVTDADCDAVMLGVGDSEPVDVTEEVGDADAVMLLVGLLVAVSLLDALSEADVDGDGDAVADTLFDWLGELVRELLALSVGL
jgi:hypothetical protein